MLIIIKLEQIYMLTSYSLRIVNGKLYGAKNRAPACLGLNFQQQKISHYFNVRLSSSEKFNLR